MRERLTALGRVLLENPVKLAALLLLAVLLCCAVLGPWMVPYDPIATNTRMALQPPSATHWFGTDQLGRDVFSRVLTATRLDLGIAFAAVLLSLAMGAVLGAAMGYFQGWLDAVGGRFTDVLMAFPLLVLGMVMVAALGNSVFSVICATAVINLPFYIRLARAEVSIRRTMGYVEAARVGGSSHARILRVFLLPNILPPLVVQASVNLGWAVLNTAGLSFIGLGVRAPAPEWGIMVAEGAQFVSSGRWWIAAFPGLALMLAVLCFNLLGDGLRDVVDPRSRR
jgi:peptide/nickel transport system permease protein